VQRRGRGQDAERLDREGGDPVVVGCVLRTEQKRLVEGQKLPKVHTALEAAPPTTHLLLEAPPRHAIQLGH
jgi:hypothetical protein